MTTSPLPTTSGPSFETEETPSWGRRGFERTIGVGGSVIVLFV
jgi:hypothetical protein